MTEFIYFLGRFHVLVLHLPIGILLLAVVAEILSRRERFRGLQSAVDFMWLAGAISAIVTVALGYMHASEGGFEGSALNGHRLGGTLLAVVACVIWAVRSGFGAAYARAWPVGCVSIIALLFVTGHFGGNLTHGETYLVQYAPGPLQRLAGAEVRTKPQNLAGADIYLDVVRPALEQRCATCHNESKRKGGLDVSSYAALMKGGETGAVVVAGAAENSDLYRRITLPHDDEDFMPKDGKTPLSAEQTAAIGWWISIGAPATGVMAALKPTPEIQASLESVLGFGGAPASSAPPAAEVAQGQRDEGVPQVDVPPADQTVVDALENSGFVVRSIAAGSPLVHVDYTAARDVSAQDMEQLAKIGPQIYTLNMRDAGVKDEHLATIGKFAHLDSLRLEMNPITDAGLAQLAGLKNLTYLNLYGTRITDKGVDVLSHMEKLGRLFVWQTSITQAGVAQLKRAHADLIVDGGFDPRNFPVGPKVIPVVN